MDFFFYDLPIKRLVEVARLFSAGAEKNTGDVEKLLKESKWNWRPTAVDLEINLETTSRLMVEHWCFIFFFVLNDLQRNYSGIYIYTNIYKLFHSKVWFVKIGAKMTPHDVTTVQYYWYMLVYTFVEYWLHLTNVTWARIYVCNDSWSCSFRIYGSIESLPKFPWKPRRGFMQGFV